MIIVITGLMASGKSTVSELLAKQTNPSVHVRGDIFRKMIISGREEMCATPSAEAIRQLKLRYKLTADVAKRYHESGFIVIVQDNYYGKMLPLFLDLLQGEHPQVFVLCPTLETIKQRELGRGKNAYTQFDIDTLYQSFMRATPRIGHWIDNSLKTPMQTAQKILELLEVSL